MATAERAAVGAEKARLEGRGPVGQTAEAAKNAATGRDGVGVGSGVGAPVTARGDSIVGGGPAVGSAAPGTLGTGVESRGFPGHHRRSSSAGSGLMERTEEELARLRNRTQITHEGEAYCPNPNLRDLPKEFETRVQIIQRYPEMRTVEKTDWVKEIHHEERTIMVPKTRVIMDEIEHIDRIPVVRQVAKIRIEIVHRVITEEREVTDMVPVIEYMDVPRIEQVPRVIMEEVEEVIRVPVVREVPVTRMVEIPTGNYCEAPAGEFINPGHFNLLGKGHHKTGLFNRSKSSSSSSSSDNEVATPAELDTSIPNVHHHADGTSTVSPTGSAKRKSLLQRIIHH